MLRNINIDDGQDMLQYEEFVFEVALPCAAFFIPEDEKYRDFGEDFLKFAKIPFFDRSSLSIGVKTAVKLG